MAPEEPRTVMLCGSHCAVLSIMLPGWFLLKSQHVPRVIIEQQSSLAQSVPPGTLLDAIPAAEAEEPGLQLLHWPVQVPWPDNELLCGKAAFPQT